MFQQWLRLIHSTLSKSTCSQKCFNAVFVSSFLQKFLFTNNAGLSGPGKKFTHQAFLLSYCYYDGTSYASRKIFILDRFFPEHQNQSQFTSLDNSFERFRLEKKKKRKKVFDLNEAQTEQACLFGSTEQNIYNLVMLFPSKQLIHIPCFKSSLQNADFLY